MKAFEMSDVLRAFEQHENRFISTFESAAIKAMQDNHKKWNNVFNSSAFKVAQIQEERLSKLFGNQALMAIRVHEERWNSIISSSAMKAIQAQEENLRNILTSSSLKFMRAHEVKWKNIFESSVLSSARFHQEKWNKLFKIPTLDAFNLARDIISSPEFSQLNVSNFTLDETASLVEEFYSDEEKPNPAPLVSLEGYIRIFLSLILFLSGYAASIESDDNLLIQIEQIETKVLDQLSFLRREEEEGTFYVVKRTINLRSKGSTGKSSVVIDVLYPNQRVKLLQRRGKWIYGSYFDYISEVQKNGWVYKKYLLMER